MTFLPRQQLLTLEEMAFISRAFVELGVRKIRITGGEPLIRQNIVSLLTNIAVIPQLDELLITTNGSQLVALSQQLVAAGVTRINVSIDSLRPERFARITRNGDLEHVLKGIDAAQTAGVVRIKLNSVIIRGRNDDEILPLVDFAVAKGLDISFIEEMPLGHIGERNRLFTMVTSAEVRQIIRCKYHLTLSDETTAGPSRYYRLGNSNSRIGFISPYSQNFCGSCNRVRVTCEGKLLLCLGNENAYDLKAAIRSYPGDIDKLKSIIVEAINYKPMRHYFYRDDAPQIVRFMNASGG